MVVHKPLVVYQQLHPYYLPCRWADKEAWDQYRREHLRERFDGDTTKSAGVGGAVKQQQHEEEHNEGGGGGDSVDIFLRDASATKGIHCRMGMDGVSGVFLWETSCGVLLNLLHGSAAMSPGNADVLGCVLKSMSCHLFVHQTRPNSPHWNSWWSYIPSLTSPSSCGVERKLILTSRQQQGGSPLDQYWTTGFAFLSSEWRGQCWLCLGRVATPSSLCFCLHGCVSLLVALNLFFDQVWQGYLSTNTVPSVL